ncbi:hypothetical protein C8R43DRAFT_955254 [Mycena crocata]|nr:hypothetical protein C8R43DRAFT_955254 [Mycena crocata]
MPSSSASSSSASTSSPLITEYQTLQAKKDVQRAKARARMARYCQRLKEQSPEAQQAAQERARDAQARYHAQCVAIMQSVSTALTVIFAETGLNYWFKQKPNGLKKFGVAVYEAKMEQRCSRREAKADRQRRPDRVKAPRSTTKKSTS